MQFNTEKTKQQLKEMNEQLDAMAEYYNPTKKRHSLQNQMVSKSELSSDELDEIFDKVGDIIDSNDFELVIEECLEVCIKLTDLYDQAGCPDDCIYAGELCMIFVEDLDTEIENWYDDMEDLSPTAISMIHVIDCIIKSYLQLGHDFEPSDSQMEDLHALSEALDLLSPESWRLEVDHLRRQLDLCKAILQYGDDDEIKDRYMELCMDLVYKALPDSDADRDADTEEDAEKFHFIHDITKDKDVVCDYLRYATTINNLTEDEREDVNNWSNLFK